MGFSEATRELAGSFLYMTDAFRLQKRPQHGCGIRERGVFLKTLDEILLLLGPASQRPDTYLKETQSREKKYYRIGPLLEEAIRFQLSPGDARHDRFLFRENEILQDELFNLPPAGGQGDYGRLLSEFSPESNEAVHLSMHCEIAELRGLAQMAVIAGIQPAVNAMASGYCSSAAEDAEANRRELKSRLIMCVLENLERYDPRTEGSPNIMTFLSPYLKGTAADYFGTRGLSGRTHYDAEVWGRIRSAVAGLKEKKCRINCATITSWINVHSGRPISETTVEKALEKNREVWFESIDDEESSLVLVDSSLTPLQEILQKETASEIFGAVRSLSRIQRELIEIVQQVIAEDPEKVHWSKNNEQYYIQKVMDIYSRRHGDTAVEEKWVRYHIYFALLKISETFGIEKTTAQGGRFRMI